MTEMDLNDSGQGIDSEEARYRWNHSNVVMLADTLIPIIEWRAKPDLDGITEMLLSDVTMTSNTESNGKTSTAFSSARVCVKNINLTPDPNDQASIFFTMTEMDLNDSGQGIDSEEARYRWNHSNVVMLADTLIPIIEWRVKPDLDGITEMLLSDVTMTSNTESNGKTSTAFSSARVCVKNINLTPDKNDQA
ncbi:unnamed protein product [Leptidea sinapis]|uniref:Uncharacterized protein n=1 Tax=Leptidea sinapis TaxID=189913 RepID=A0A5E4QF78_9NEOP|nr:unnamed protein product [Leptidea sinapis]